MPHNPPVAYLELWHWCAHGCVSSLSLSHIRLYTSLGTGQCVFECACFGLDLCKLPHEEAARGLLVCASVLPRLLRIPPCCGSLPLPC